MKKYLVILFSCLSLNVFSQSNQIDWLQVHNLSIQGISELYNLNTDRAKELFDRIIDTAPGDPRGYFFNCMLYYLRYSVERNQADFDDFFTSSEKVIEICENLIDQNSIDYNARFYLAGIYGYRGIMYQINNSIIKAVWDGRKGFSMLRDLVKEKPDLYDAYLGTGIFDYLLAKIPSGYAWVLKILGYGGDKEKGIKELKIAEEKGMYTRTEAALYLSQFLMFEDRFTEAFLYIKKLIKEYPENSLFLALYGNMESRINKPENAIPACKKAIEINKRKKIVPADEIVYIVLANSLFLMNDFGEAAENYEIYLKKVPNIEIIRNYNFYRMGLSFDFSGNREKAVKVYKLCKKVDIDDHPDDALMYDLSRLLIDNPPGENYKLLTMANNKFNLKKFDEAIEDYINLKNRIDITEDEKIACLINLGSCYYEKKMYTEALNYFNEGILTKPSFRKYLIPHLYLKTGQTLVKLGRKEEAQTALKKVFESDNYYYENRIEEQAKEELKNLK
jgi:tetratricopeptide (TPR) repeat protein